MKKRKILVIGLDGGTWDVLLPWIQEGKLPTLANLMQEGVWGSLQSTIPPISPTAWASFMTGMNPGKHGILDFTYRRDGMLDRVPVNARIRDGRSLWRILSDAGKRAVVINVPLTYPPEEINGVLISGFPVPRDSMTYTHPPELAHRLAARGYNLADVPTQTYSPANLEPFLEELYQRMEERTCVALELMDQIDWDFFMVHYIETDKAQHELLNYLAYERGKTTCGKAGQAGQAILHLFQEADQHVQRLIEAASDNCTVLIVSDHGFGPCYQAVHLNTWLLQQGYLQIKESPVSRLRHALFRSGITPLALYRLLPDVFQRFAKRKADERFFIETERSWFHSLLGKLANILQTPFLTFNDVDWRRTRAYALGNSGMGHIYLNVRGREPTGIIKMGKEYEETRTEIAEKLTQLRDPHSGDRIIDAVYRREEIYKGPYREKAADLIVSLSDFRYLNYATPLFLSRQVVNQGNVIAPDRASHTMNGMFILTGDPVQSGQHISGAQIVDLAPTILYMLRLPIPTTMDGRVLKEVFSEQEWADHQPVYEDMEARSMPSSQGLTEEEERQLTESLRALGYL